MNKKTYRAIKHIEPGEGRSQDLQYVCSADFSKERNINYLLLADPVGSSELSEKTAELATKIVRRKLNQEMKTIKTQDNLERLIDYSFSIANSCVIALNKKEKEKKPQDTGATTLLAMAIYKKTAQIAAVGDIRAYVLYKNGDFQQLTKDETSAWLSYEQGHFNSPDEIKVHPSSRDLKNAVGLLENLKIQHYMIDMDAVDTVLLASDGYYKCLLDEEIKESLKEKDLNKAFKKLNELAAHPKGIISLSMDVNRIDEETARAIFQQDSKSAIILREVANDP